jgi:hypothetical protein
MGATKPLNIKPIPENRNSAIKIKAGLAYWSLSTDIADFEFRTIYKISREFKTTDSFDVISIEKKHSFKI